VTVDSAADARYTWYPHDAALDHLRLTGHRVVALWVLEANVRARSMYERWGWHATPARQSVYAGVDEVLYLRDL
jgi:hypothetical protein